MTQNSCKVRTTEELPFTVVLQSEEYGKETYECANLQEALGKIKAIILSTHIVGDGVKRVVGIELNSDEEEDDEEDEEQIS